MSIILEECNKRFSTQKEYLGVNKPVNKMTPLVSVNVATYQHAAFIARCLDGILMQETSFPVEILVGEDESSDGTREICIAYAEKHPDKVRLFLRKRHESQYYNEQGVFVTRFNGRWNKMAARGKYMAVCEGDDYWTDPRKLQKQVDFLESNPDFAICHHNMQVVYEDNDKPPHLSNSPSQKPVTTILDLAEGNYIYNASVCYRQQDAVKMTEWTFYTPAGDYPNHLLNAQYGKIRYFPEVMGVYRVHRGGIWEYHSQEYRRQKWVTVLEYCRTAFSDEVNQKLTCQLVNNLMALILSPATPADKVTEFSRKILDLDPMFLRRLQADHQTRIKDLEGALQRVYSSWSYRTGNFLLAPVSRLSKSLRLPGTES